MHHRKPTRAETPIERIYRVKLAAKCRHPSSASCSASERLNASPVRVYTCKHKKSGYEC